MTAIAPTDEQIDTAAAQLADDPTYAHAYGALAVDIGALAALHGPQCTFYRHGVVCQQRAVLISALALIAAVDKGTP